MMGISNKHKFHTIIWLSIAEKYPTHLKTKNMALERALSRVVGSQVVVEHHHEEQGNAKQVHEHGQLHISHHPVGTNLEI